MTALPLAILLPWLLLNAVPPAMGQLGGAMVLAEREKPKEPEKKPEVSVEGRVREILVEQLGVKPEVVTLKARLREDLGSDELDLLELELAFEEAFELELDSKAMEKLLTVQDVVSYVQKHGKRK